MTRDDMIAKLCLRDEGMHLMGRIPTRFVTVGGPADKYSDAELALLAAFTDERQADYHQRCGNAKLDWNDNFISIDKEVDGEHVRWGRKRYSWREGAVHASSLPEAVAAFWGDHYRRDVVGQICLLGTGDIVEIVARIPWDAEDRVGDYACRRLTDGAEIAIRQHEVGVVAISATSIEQLGDLMRMAVEHRIANQRAPQPGEIGASRAATTTSDDPVALTAMWASRVLDWREREMLRRAA